MSRLQNEDFKSSAQLAAAGATDANLLNDSKIYLTANGLNKRLDQAIVAGDLSGGGGGGSGDGAINYVSNGKFESSTTGWATYADAAQTTPVDGTGGSPTLTLTRTTTTPLRSTASGLITKSAANLQGQGVSFDFTIDRADQAKVLTVSFDYDVASGTYATGDLTVYILPLDGTNTTLIQPAGFQIQSITSGNKATHCATFQTTSDATSYRLIYHVATTSASAYSLRIDNVKVSPQVVAQGTPVTDWTSFTPTGSWTGAVSYAGRWRRVGDSMELDVTVTASGSPTGGSLTVNLPSGYSIDTTKITSSTADGYYFGIARIVDSGSTGYLASVLYESATALRLRSLDDGAVALQDSSRISPTVPMTWAASDTLQFVVSLPISGWSSQTVTSDSADTRVCAARVYKTAQESFASSSTRQQLTMSGVIRDTHGAWGSNQYRVAVAGDYVIDVQAIFGWSGSEGRAAVIEIRIDGTVVSQGQLDSGGWGSGAFSGPAVTAKYEGFLNAGQIVTFFLAQQNAGGAARNVIGEAAGASTWAQIVRQSGPATIAASETIAASYTTTAGQSITVGTEQTVVFGTRDFDTHGIVNSSTGVVTIPTAGKWEITANLFTGAANFTTAQEFQLFFRKNAATSDLVANFFGNGANHGHSIRCTKQYDCMAGDTLQVRVATDLGVSLSTVAGRNYVLVRKVV